MMVYIELKTFQVVLVIIMIFLGSWKFLELIYRFGKCGENKKSQGGMTQEVPQEDEDANNN